MPRLPLTPWKIAGLLAGAAAFAALVAVESPLQHHGPYGARPARAAAVTALMAIFWVTEALPIALTALAPLILFPALGVLGPLDAARPYADSYIFLFAGGMAIAAAMQQWDLHRRIALGILHAIGTDARRTLAGVLAATAFISLWISNTATAAMMLPIGLAIVAQLERRAGVAKLPGFGAAIMLAIAYAANVGGIGTKIGTAPNAQFAGFLAQQHGRDVSFLAFMAVGLPFVLLFLPVVWLALWRVARRDAPRDDPGEGAIRRERAALGPLRRPEKIVLGVFAATAAVWIAGLPIARALSVRPADVEGGAAIAAAVALALWPVGGRRVLELRSLRGLHWGALVLLGGGFSMAHGVKESGLSDYLAARLATVRDLAPFLQIEVAAIATVALSAVASNTATIAIMLNVLSTSVAPEAAPAVLFAATIGASCDFALPAGTPPNAMVFASGYVTVPRMAKTGIVLDVLAALLAGAWCAAVVPLVL